MTKQEAEQMLERLRQIFPIVRLLEETDVPENREDIHPGGAEDGEKAIENSFMSMGKASLWCC